MSNFRHLQAQKIILPLISGIRFFFSPLHLLHTVFHVWFQFPLNIQQVIWVLLTYLVGSDYIIFSSPLLCQVLLHLYYHLSLCLCTSDCYSSFLPFPSLMATFLSCILYRFFLEYVKKGRHSTPGHRVSLNMKATSYLSFFLKA